MMSQRARRAALRRELLALHVRYRAQCVCCMCFCFYTAPVNKLDLPHYHHYKMAQPATKGLKLADVYRNLYPWSDLNQFFDIIKGTIAYTSPDKAFIALNKPFGVGIYTADDLNTSKQNTDKLLSRIPGRPRYCMKDILKPLTDELKSPNPYVVLKGIDRYMSGLILITNDPENYQPRFKKAIASGRVNKQPPYGMRAITSGYPLLKTDKIYEKVGVDLVEVDELGDYKEPVIVPALTDKHKKNHQQDKTTFQAELEIKKINRKLSTSLVELYVSKISWDFPRCYISSKTSFILGDVRFSKRIREILGRPIQVSAFKSSQRYDDGYEPLNSKLRNQLGVYKNASIPLMLDLHAIRLKGFDRTQKRGDLVIKSPYMPVHFALTAERLNLLDDNVDDDDLSRSSY